MFVPKNGGYAFYREVDCRQCNVFGFSRLIGYQCLILGNKVVFILTVEESNIARQLNILCFSECILFEYTSYYSRILFLWQHKCLIKTLYFTAL